MAGLDQRTLTCPSCDGHYAIERFDSGARYLCAKCRVVLAGAGTPHASYDTLESNPTAHRGLVYVYRRERGARADAVPPLRRVDHFDIIEEIGRGGMGVVYLARDRDDGAAVALKVLLAGVHGDEKQVKRFTREARAAARLNHPNIVRVLEIGRHDGHVYFTMPLIRGPTVQEVLEDVGALPMDEALRIAAGVARGLHAAHVAGLVHRDIKPANILLTPGGRPMIADFGLVAETTSTLPRLTETGLVLGTPAYMAPEQAVGRSISGAASDQYSLGAVLHEMISGEPPYAADSAMQVLVDLVADVPPPLQERLPNLPREVALIAERVLARDPSLRYPSALALAEDIERYLAGHPVRARPLPTSYRLRLWARRHARSLWIGTTAVLTLLVAVWLFALWTGAGSRRAESARETLAAERLQAVEARIVALWADGSTAEADAALQAFSDIPEHRGTRAAAAAQVRHAQRKTSAGDPTGAVEHYAQAYTGSSEAALQVQALSGMAAVFREQWQWQQLETVLATLGTVDPDAAGEPGTLLLRAEAALALDDPSRGRDLLERARAAGASTPVLPALQALLPGHVTSWSSRSAMWADIDGDGREDILTRPLGDGPLQLVDPGDIDVVAGSVDLQLDDQRPELLYPLPASEPGPWVMGWFPRSAQHPARAAVFSLASGGAPVFAWPESLVHGVVVTDLDGGGTDEIYVAVGPYARRLLELVPGEPWSLAVPHPGTDATNSDLMGVVSADLDGDGHLELVAAAGAWRAYDLRVFSRRDPTAPLQLRARKKVGYVSSLATLTVGGAPALAVAKADLYPNPEVFGTEAPFGAPAGVWLYRLEGDRLVRIGGLPAPFAGADLGRLHVGDFDGDGLDDLAAAVTGPDGTPFTLLARQQADGTLAAMALGGLDPLAVGALDADSADELLVTRAKDHRAVVLGRASEAEVERQRRPAAGRTPLPAGVADADGLDVRAWSRAEDLVSMGLAASAAPVLEELAGWSSDPEVGYRAVFRAAELWVDAGHERRGAELYERAARAPALHEIALARAADTYASRHHFADAQRVLRALGSTEGLSAQRQSAATAQLERLEPSTTDLRREELSFDPLDPRLAVLDPVAIRRDPAAGTLELAVLGDDSDAAAAGLTWAGHHLRLQVRLDLQRVEWGAGLRVGVEGPGKAEHLAVGVMGWGGGAFLERQVGCMVPGQAGLVGPREPVDLPSAPARLLVTADLSVHTGQVVCTIEDADGALIHEDVVPLQAELPTGELALLLGPLTEPGLREPMVAAASIHSLSLSGPGVVLTAGAGPERNHLLADGDAAGAAAAPGPQGAIARAMALAEEGHWTEAEGLLGAIARSPEAGVPDEVGHLLRTRAETLGPLLRGGLGSEYFARFARAWAGAIHAHTADPEVQRALTTALSDVERAATRGTADERRPAVNLLLARGEAWLAMNELTAARRDLVTGTRAGVELSASLDGPDRVDLGRRLSAAWRQLAMVELTLGDPEAALAHARASVAAAPAPEIALDALRALPLVRDQEGAQWRAFLAGGP